MIQEVRIYIRGRITQESWIMIYGLLLRGYIGEYKWDLAAWLRSLDFTIEVGWLRSHEFITEELYRSSV